MRRLAPMLGAIVAIGASFAVIADVARVGVLPRSRSCWSPGWWLGSLFARRAAVSSCAGRPGRPVAAAPGRDRERRSRHRSPTAAPTVAASRRQVVAALARVESRAVAFEPVVRRRGRVLRVLSVLFGWVGPRTTTGRGARGSSSCRSWPTRWSGMAVVGAHHAVTRGSTRRRRGAVPTCPAGESTRTVAQLLAGWVPAAAIVAIRCCCHGRAHHTQSRIVRPDRRSRPGRRARRRRPRALRIALGVALARWTPWRLAPIVAVAALVPVIVELGTREPHWSNARQLSTWPRFPTHDLLFTDPPGGGTCCGSSHFARS